ncbi:response regulator [Hydrogenimonas sp. SS33]|uniref:response regulator transcription factor n=1 Tax=Hydrogenimonas leucolamina TaxID=2954236 RepID=UPI00336C1623
MIQENGYTVLYAEDEEIIRNAYIRVLSRYFKTVIGAKDGEEALKLYERHKPDIVIADIVLPGLSGLSLIERIRQSDDTTRTILMTAYSDTEKLLKATELNITKYLIKPVKKETLKEAIERAVQQLEKLKKPLLPLAGKFSYNKKENLLLYNGEPLTLSQNEECFISILTSKPGDFFPVAKIAELFYLNYDKDLSGNAVKSLIKRLRKKLPEKLIENRFGAGYRILPG